MARQYYLDTAHTQRFEITAEDWNGGAPATIAIAEERSDPDLVEFHSPEASGATRTFYCPWESRWQVVATMLGFPLVNLAAGSYPDATGWNGLYVGRRKPMAYDLGEGEAAINRWVWATRATVRPWGRKENLGTGGVYPSITYRPGATTAKIEVQFAALDYNVLDDSEILYSGTLPNVSCGQEWLRYARITQKPTGQFFQYPSEALQLVDYPSAGQKQPLHFWPAVIDNVADFWIHVHDLPYDPTESILSCFGKVNKSSIFVTPDMPFGHPAETLHFVAADITRQVPRFDTKLWSMGLGFKKVYNRDKYLPLLDPLLDADHPLNVWGQLVGHNHVRHIWDAGGGIKKLRFFRVSNDGTATLTGDNPMIGLIDFRRIFWIPDSYAP